jgi:hypothetical protein
MTFPAVICSLSLQGKRDLNPQPSVLETDALPIELLPSDAPVYRRAVTRAHENNGDWTPRQESLTEYCDESRTPERLAMVLQDDLRWRNGVRCGPACRDRADLDAVAVGLGVTLNHVGSGQIGCPVVLALRGCRS